MAERRQSALVYAMPRRRARHRDKIFSYFAMILLYIVLQLVLTSSKSVETNKTVSTTKEPIVGVTTPATTKEMKGAATSAGTTTTTPSNALSSLNEITTEPDKKPTAVPTWRPKRENCTAPAIEQFPRPLMGPTARKNGGIIIHILVAIYAFIALAIVCDDYFVSSLDRICEELKLSPDVAGATFMAAGSSAPELATVVIGVFFAKDDIGVSGVIGSAVFNIMFVISICALCTSTVSYLNWWPLCRDCFFYALSILLMLFSIYNEKISWGESLFMLIMYVVYCAVLHYNPILEKWAQTWPVPCKRQPEEQAGLVTYKTLNEDKSRRPSYTQSPDKIQFGEPNFVEGDGQNPQQPYAGHVPQGAPQQPEYYKPKPSDPNEISPLIKPTEGGMIPLITWYLTVPIHYMCRLTLPDCKSEKYKNWYPFTFVLSMVWISFYSYIMVWMITICGSTMGIPDTVMGLTFVAAGVSVPDALSSLAVVKEGYGDMAVSNAVGSNVFDILICLGLPWFIQTALIKPGSHVNVISKGLTYSTLSLLSTVLFLLVATHMNGWKLDKKYGVILMIWYILFITFASLYELNVFGYMNPPECAMCLVFVYFMTVAKICLACRCQEEKRRLRSADMSDCCDYLPRFHLPPLFASFS